MSIFEALHNIANSALFFYKKYEGTTTIPPIDDIEWIYVGNNILNGPLVQMENIFDFVHEDIGLKLQRIDRALLGVLIIIVTVQVICYVLVFVVEVRYVKQKQNFVEVFMRIQPDEIEGIIEMGKKLQEQLLNTSRLSNDETIEE